MANSVSSKNASERITVPQAAVENAANRVFVTHPRLFSFSQRNLASLRHPYLPVAITQAEIDAAKAKRQWQSRAERLADMLTPSSATIKFEDERWRHVGYMLDTVMFETQISSRRAAVLESPAVKRAIETLWCKAGGSSSAAVTRAQYTQMHLALYEKLVGANDASLATIFSQAIDADWSADRDSDDTLPFGRFFISFVELADNWIPSCEADNYASFLADVSETCWPGTPASSRAVERVPWDDIVESLRRTAMQLDGMPVISAQRNAANTVVYVKSPV